MKKALIFVCVLIVSIIFITIGLFISSENKKNSKVQSDYTNYIGTWSKIDPDQMYGEIFLDIINVEGNNITFSLDESEERTETIENNQIKWTEMWHDGEMGHTLILDENHITLEYSRDSFEWYRKITFERGNN